MANIYEGVGAGKATGGRRGNPKMSSCYPWGQRQVVLLSGHLEDARTIVDLWWQLLERPSEPKRTEVPSFTSLPIVVGWIVPLKTSRTPGNSGSDLIWKSNHQCSCKRNAQRHRGNGHVTTEAETKPRNTKTAKVNRSWKRRRRVLS